MSVDLPGSQQLLPPRGMSRRGGVVPPISELRVYLAAPSFLFTVVM